MTGWWESTHESRFTRLLAVAVYRALGPGDFRGTVGILQEYALVGLGVYAGNPLTFLQALEINPGPLAVRATLFILGRLSRCI